MQGMVAPIANMYLKNYMSQTMQLDIEKNQNIYLFSRINLNSAIIISDRDEIVKYERYERIICEFGKKCYVNNPPMVFNTQKTHGSMRSADFVNNII